MKASLKKYLTEDIFPAYQHYDKAHNQAHIQKVIENSMLIAKDYDVCLDMVYVIAMFHDLGLPFGRQDHHLSSAILAYYDSILNESFSQEQLLIIKEAIEDHRASNQHAPRSIYGMIIAEADRDIDPQRIIYRTYQFGLSHYPTLSLEEQYQRNYQHLVEKYGEGGYLKLYLKGTKNEAGLKELRQWLKEEVIFKEKYQEIIQMSALEK